MTQRDRSRQADGVDTGSRMMRVLDPGTVQLLERVLGSRDAASSVAVLRQTLPNLTVG